MLTRTAVQPPSPNPDVDAARAPRARAIAEQFAYDPKASLVFTIGIASGAGFGLCAHRALDATDGLRLFGVVSLGPGAATTLFGGLAACFAAGLMAATVLAWRALLRPKFVELLADELLLPHGWLQLETSRIPYATMESVTEVGQGGSRRLVIASNGRRYTVLARLLPDEAAYARVREHLRPYVMLRHRRAAGS